MYAHLFSSSPFLYFLLVVCLSSSDCFFFSFVLSMPWTHFKVISTTIRSFTYHSSCTDIYTSCIIIRQLYPRSTYHAIASFGLMFLNLDVDLVSKQITCSIHESCCFVSEKSNTITVTFTASKVLHIVTRMVVASVKKCCEIV